MKPKTYAVLMSLVAIFLLALFEWCFMTLYSAATTKVFANWWDMPLLVGVSLAGYLMLATAMYQARDKDIKNYEDEMEKRRVKPFLNLAEEASGDLLQLLVDGTLRPTTDVLLMHTMVSNMADRPSRYIDKVDHSSLRELINRCAGIKRRALEKKRYQAALLGWFLMAEPVEQPVLQREERAAA